MPSTVPAAPPALPATTVDTAARTVALRKTYGSGRTAVHALAGVDVAFERGRFTAVMGPSGSGKSTLMHLLAALDRPSAGAVLLGDIDITQLSEKELTRLRRDRIGFVFPSFNLLPVLSAAENIQLPARLAGRSVEAGWFDRIVETVGLGDRLSHRPAELSGGQQQRVAVARALATRPEIVFADEPTGNLDSNAGAEVLTFLRRSVDETGQTIVMVTHDATAAAHADRVVFLADGELRTDLAAPTVGSILDTMKQLGA